MASGGARTRSGPPPDPSSKRSDRRGVTPALRDLPAAGFSGSPPAWPLPTGSPRERSLWKKVWKFPQATAWKEEPWRWLTIAHYVRWAVKSEAADASPSTMTQVLRLATDIGISPAGLRENGWIIKTGAEDEEEKPATASHKPQASSRRLRAVDE